MLAAPAGFRDYFPPKHLSLEVLSLGALLLGVLSTGTVLFQYILIPALFSEPGLGALFVSFLTLLVAIQGVVFPFYLLRNRPYARLAFLTLLFIAAMVSHLAFIDSWWSLLQEYRELTIHTAAAGDEYSLRDALLPPRNTIFPYLFSALSHVFVLGAYLACLLWNSFLPNRLRDTSTWAGADE